MMDCTWIQRNEPRAYELLHPESRPTGDLTPKQRNQQAWMDMCDAIGLATTEQMEQITAFALSIGVQQYEDDEIV